MPITSMTFLFVFLPIALFLYYFVDSKAQEAVLLIISLFFYAIGSVEYIVLFSIAVFLSVLIGRGIDSCDDNALIKKCLFFCGIVLNIVVLLYYKCSPVLDKYTQSTSKEVQVKDIALPLGISFFVFKSISYLIDVYKRRIVLGGTPLKDALYLSFFAQIQSGPISRYSDMGSRTPMRFDFDMFSDGVFRFIIGFSKKIIIANNLSNITTEVFNAPFESFSTSYAWLGSICYSLQLFFDFSGYSDMAIGITEMFGYKCPENFNYPYMTDSITKFWRRWHITLSEWFRDYIYVPLGGSRNNNKYRVYFNLFVVWILTGIWHGSAWNFVIWGMGYFVAISLERFFVIPGRFRLRLEKSLYRVLVLIFINFQWVIFYSKNLESGLKFIKRMILPYKNELADRRVLFLIKDYSFFIISAIVLSTPIISKIGCRVENNKKVHIVYEMMMSLLIVGAFVWAVSFVVAGHNNPFAYANF